MSLPAGWPAPADVETLPVVWLHMDGSAWPPAEGDRPAGLVPVGDWEMERELVGSTLPGNVRARSGLSIGAASASIAQMSVQPLAPWAITDERRVTVGRGVALYAAHDGFDTPARVDLGDWIVAPTSGSILAPSVDVELIERQYEARRQDQLLPFALDTPDPAWIVDRLARQAGYYSTPPTVPSALVAVPLAGGLTPEAGLFGGALEVTSYGRASGALGPEGGDFLAIYLHFANPVDDGCYLTLNVEGTVTVEFGVYGSPYGATIKVTDTGTLRVIHTASTGVSGTFTPGLSADHPHRVQVQIVRTITAGTATALAARARSAPDAPWSSWVTHTANSTATSFPHVVVSTDDAVSGLQVTTADDPGLWAPVNAVLYPLGGRLPAPHLPGDMNAWTAIQEVCSANLGICWIDRQGTLQLRNRDYLAGAGIPATVLDVGRHVEDLGWTIDPADAADRLVVTYTPADLEEQIGTGEPPLVWQAEDIIELRGGQTLEIVAEIDIWAQLANRWIQSWYNSSLYLGSWYGAYPNRDGSGTHAEDDAVAVSHRVASTGRVIITLVNTTSSTLYMVNGSGEPTLRLNGFSVARLASTASVQRGADEDAAVNPLTIDLGRYVQRAEDAETIADFIWARVSSPAWKASSVRVKLDWSRDIGDVLQLVHARSGLEAKAMVTKVAYSGTAGEVVQSLDLVLLPPTWADFDEAWTGETWADFDSAWATPHTWAGFDRDPLRTES